MLHNEVDVESSSYYLDTGHMFTIIWNKENVKAV